MAHADYVSNSTPPTHHDAVLAQHSYEALSQNLKSGTRFKIYQGKKTDIEIPEAAARLLVDILAQMAGGHAVAVTTVEKELTTQQAADLLNVSRPYLVKLLETNQIPHRKVGSKRRVLAQDVLAFKEKQTKQRLKTLAALSKQAQELDMGY